MQLWHKLRYLAGWTCTVTCGFLLFCDTLIFMLIQMVSCIFLRRKGSGIILL